MDKRVKINFIVPFKPRRPAGGFRVIYEYANRLVALGYDIHITYPVEIPYVDYSLPFWLRNILSNSIYKLTTNRWFKFDPHITMSNIPRVEEQYVVDADIVIGTWWSVVREIGKFGRSKGLKINLIQGYETWLGHVDLLHQSYNLEGFTNVVVSSYLKKLVERYTINKTTIIENGIDSNVFHIKKEIEDRNPLTIAMTYSLQEIKGSDFGLEALKLVKAKYPALQAELFGICPKPDNLPEWISYHRDPQDLPDLYNRNAIFISNSFTEGFPLTPAEAMSCGCALVCTDIDGHREYAVDDQNALLVEIKNPEQMAEKIAFLIENNDKRITLAHNGNRDIQRYNWDNAVRKMLEIINNLLKVSVDL